MTARLLKSSLSLFAALLLLATGATATAGTIQPRIIGGSDAGAGQFPFMVALVDTAPLYLSDFYAQFCGGTLVAADWVLTASHCVTTESGAVVGNNTLAVIAGVTVLNASGFDTGARHAVDLILRHPAFDYDTLENDLALLHLTTPATADPLFAPDDGTYTTPLVLNSVVTAAGWGLTSQTPAITLPELQQVDLEFIPFAICDDNAHYDGSLNPDTVCAGFTSGTPRDACFGDSGGPLLVGIGGGAWRQIGITSYGDISGCAQAAFPGVYTRVATFHAFITGAPTRPDIEVTASTAPGVYDGVSAMVRFTLRNNSPINTAHNVVLTTVHALGTFTIPGTSGAGSCISIGGDNYSCAVGTLAPGTTAIVDISVLFSGTGTFRLEGTASNDDGDYYADNDTDGMSYTISSRPSGDGGALPAAWLLALGLLAGRRRAPKAKN